MHQFTQAAPVISSLQLTSTVQAERVGFLGSQDRVSMSGCFVPSMRCCIARVSTSTARSAASQYCPSSTSLELMVSATHVLYNTPVASELQAKGG